METQKKLRKVLKFQSLLLSQPNQSLNIARIDTLARRLGFKQYEAGDFLLKYPLIFEIYQHPVQRILFCQLTRKAILQIEEEKFALNVQISDAVTCLRKLLRLSNTGRVRLEHVRIARVEFGLPDDFEYSVILKHPQYFRLFDAEETRNKYIEISELEHEHEHDPKVLKDPNLTVCAIERLRERGYRERRVEAEDIRFAFNVKFPPGFKINKYHKIAVWKWQRLPYWSPYEDISGYDLRSIEARKRLEKRGVAMIHELLSITVEKKLTLERIAHFRMAMDLPKKLKLVELIKMSSRKYSGGHEIGDRNFRRDRDYVDRRSFGRQNSDNSYERFAVQDKLPIDGKRGNESHSDSSVSSGSDGEGHEDSDSELDLGFGSGSTCNNSVSEGYISAEDVLVKPVGSDLDLAIVGYGLGLGPYRLGLAAGLPKQGNMPLRVPPALLWYRPLSGLMPASAVLIGCIPGSSLYENLAAGQAIHVCALMRLDLTQASVDTIYVTVWASSNISLHLE
ncbi:hypothetical protein GIB67_042618 [Kingdonia uniflora]|uniref:PORR domain-containing protein n=1 Tax=Kingdonia uniflora TaxID=39325 RepID=A0A7J7M197_9MAGN|nr:hypothetical protein GIB67_042618 [Kingdonia uniflora]